MPDVPASKLPYRTPQLTAYGDLRKLTFSSGGKMGTTDRITTVRGSKPNFCLEQFKTGIDLPFDEECDPPGRL